MTRLSRARRRSAAIVLVLLCMAASLLGCEMLKGITLKIGEATPEGRGQADYDGPECQKRSRGPDDHLAFEVVLRTCRDSHVYGSGSQASLAIQKRHRSFDDRHPDMLAAAYNVVDCARYCENFPLAMGVSAYYADILDRATLAAQLAQLDLSPAIREAFVERALRAKDEVRAAAAKLDPRRRRMYVETVAKVVKTRNAYFEEHRGAYDQLDVLAARAKEARASGKAPAELVEGLTELRADYLARCDSDACRFQPFVIESTRELVLLHIAAGQELAARAENALLAEKAAGRHLFSVETGTAVYRAMEEERHEADLYARAKKGGMDAETLATRFGNPPPLPVDPVRGYIGSDRLPDLTAVLDGGGAAKLEGGIVAAVAPSKRGSHGEPLSRVSFRPNVSREAITRCYETGRVSGVRFEGRRAVLEYESVCSFVGERTQVDAVAPVFVPTGEVAEIRPGEQLEAMVDDGHHGFVVRSLEPRSGKSKAPGRVLQIRGARLGSG